MPPYSLHHHYSNIFLIRLALGGPFDLERPIDPLIMENLRRAYHTERLLIHEPRLSAKERDRRAAQALEQVWLDPQMRWRYPHEFFGGQRQRIAIARAMILKPQMLVLDEPTSALDRSVQKQIVTLLRDLQQTHDLSYLFISHDMAVVRAVADYVMVMKNGKVIEEGTTAQIFDQPVELYTRTLMQAALEKFPKIKATPESGGMHSLPPKQP